MIYGEIAAERPLILQNSKIKINCDDSETIVADGAFYAFFVDRYTFHFRKNVFYEDIVRFGEFLASVRIYGSEMIGQRILLRLLDCDEIPHWFFLEVNEVDLGEGRSVEFIANNLDTFMDYFGGVEDRLRSLHAILRQFDSVYFEYMPATDVWKMYNICESADIVMTEKVLGKWVEELESKNQIEGVSAMNELVSFLRNGQDRFISTVYSSMLSDDGTMENVVFRGSACYKNGVINKVAGAIYVRRNRGDAVGLDNYDFLTGVLNRRTIIERCEQLIENQPNADLSLCVIDVDYFKEINDTYGHAFGDEVLKKVALVIRNAVGDYGYVGRIGGDEFMVVLKGVGVGLTLRSILTALRSGVESIYTGANEPRVTVSVGSASYPTNAQSYDALFKVADFAVYLAKEKGRNRYVVYLPERHEELFKAKQETVQHMVNESKKLRPKLLLDVFHQTTIPGELRPIEDILQRVSTFFVVDRLSVFCGKDLHRYSMCVLQSESEPKLEYPSTFNMGEELSLWLKEKGFFLCSDNNEIKFKFPVFYQSTLNFGILSFIIFAFNLDTDYPILFVMQHTRERHKYGDEDCGYLKLIFEMLARRIVTDNEKNKKAIGNKAKK